MARVSLQMTLCKNCNTKYLASEEFCPVCGYHPMDADSQLMADDEAYDEMMYSVDNPEETDTSIDPLSEFETGRENWKGIEYNDKEDL